MTLALVCMSHSPLIEFVDPPEDVTREVNYAFNTVRAFVEEFDPDLIINVGPDHYNGFFYELMPAFCIGYEALSVGDYGTQAGPLNVPTAIAEELAQFVIDREIDIAVSLKMEVDHGAMQPMQLIYGDIAAKPLVPIYVNSVAPPFVSMKRIRQFGTAVGDYLKTVEQKVLIIGSGGLSHDPPVPQIATATAEQRALLLNGRHPTPEARQARQARTIATAVAFAKGEANIQDLAPEWDREFLSVIATGDLEKFDSYTAKEMDRVAGHSSHEVRTWVVADNALRASGEYRVTYEYYRPIPEYIAGFAVTTAVLV